MSCPECGLDGVDVTTHGCATQSFICIHGHRFDADTAPEPEYALAEAEAEPKSFLQRIAEGLRITPRR